MNGGGKGSRLKEGDILRQRGDKLNLVLSVFTFIGGLFQSTYVLYVLLQFHLNVKIPG